MIDEGQEVMNIGIFRNYMTQFTQSIRQLSLKPDEEEVKKS